MATKKKDVFKEPDVVKKATPKDGDFKNITKHNIFTTRGRCGGYQTINLPISEGNDTKGLESV